MEDRSERILYSSVDIESSDWNDWRAESPQELLQSNLEWEGAVEQAIGIAELIPGDQSNELIKNLKKQAYALFFNRLTFHYYSGGVVTF